MAATAYDPIDRTGVRKDWATLEARAGALSDWVRYSVGPLSSVRAEMALRLREGRRLNRDTVVCRSGREWDIDSSAWRIDSL